MSSKLGVEAARHTTGRCEVLVVVGIAALGVVLAAVVAFAPWHAASEVYPMVVHFIPPVAVAPHS